MPKTGNPKSIQFDDKFILVFGGDRSNESFKFYPESNDIRKIDNMAIKVAMQNTTVPFYDKY